MKFIRKIPDHIAIIMDGNGRWAKKRGLPRNLGHREGIRAVERTIDACLKLGIKYLTLFAFSTENWKRDKEEINGIFELARNYLSKNDNTFLNKGVKLNYIGLLKPFPDDLKSAIESIKRQTEKCDKLTLTLALNYGGRDDIIRAVNNLLNRREINSIDEQQFLKELDTKQLPEPDLVIRTSGEQRISNFLLYQMAYSELYFPKVNWPDFNEKHLIKALKVFQKRKRRFGGVN